MISRSASRRLGLIAGRRPQGQERGQRFGCLVMHQPPQRVQVLGKPTVVLGAQPTLPVVRVLGVS